MKNNQFSLRGVFLLTLFLAVGSFYVASAIRVKQVSKVNKSRHQTMALFRILEKAHNDHLAAGGSPVTETSKLGELGSFLKSWNWLTKQDESLAAINFVYGSEKLGSDGFGNSISVVANEDGVFRFVSPGLDRTLGNFDDIERQFYFTGLENSFNSMNRDVKKVNQRN